MFCLLYWFSSCDLDISLNSTQIISFLDLHRVDVALAPIIPWVSPPLSLISISALGVPSFGVIWGHSPIWSRNTFTNILPHTRSWDDSSLLSWSIEHYEIVILRYSYGPLYMIIPLENWDITLLDIYFVGATFFFVSLSVEVLETTILLDYIVLFNK